MYKFILITLLLIGCATLSQSHNKSTLKRCNEFHVRYLNECYDSCINGGETENWCEKECYKVVTDKYCE